MCKTPLTTLTSVWRARQQRCDSSSVSSAVRIDSSLAECAGREAFARAASARTNVEPADDADHRALPRRARGRVTLGADLVAVQEVGFADDADDSAAVDHGNGIDALFDQQVRHIQHGSA
jgi:hypothetical protein